MLKTYEREKLINAIIYFAGNTANCGKTKLFKLLFLLDLAHYQKTGRTITGQDYYAWELGPVPADLDSELDCEEETENSIWVAIDLQSERVIDFPRFKIVPKQPFDPDFFSKRELDLLSELSITYKNHTAKEMVEVTHKPEGPWARVYNEGSGKYERIPFELTLKTEGAAHILEKAKEHESMKEYFQALSKHCAD